MAIGRRTLLKGALACLSAAALPSRAIPTPGVLPVGTVVLIPGSDDLWVVVGRETPRAQGVEIIPWKAR